MTLFKSLIKISSKKIEIFYYFFNQNSMKKWNPSQGRLIGAKVEQYLLEISRVIQRHPHERNFHIFYTLIYGLTDGEREKVGLKDPQYYNYLKHSDLSPVDEREEDDGRGIIKVIIKIYLKWCQKSKFLPRRCFRRQSKII